MLFFKLVTFIYLLLCTTGHICFLAILVQCLNIVYCASAPLLLSVCPIIPPSPTAPGNLHMVGVGDKRGKGPLGGNRPMYVRAQEASASLR